VAQVACMLGEHSLVAVCSRTSVSMAFALDQATPHMDNLQEQHQVPKECYSSCKRPASTCLYRRKRPAELQACFLVSDLGQQQATTSVPQEPVKAGRRQSLPATFGKCSSTQADFKPNNAALSYQKSASVTTVGGGLCHKRSSSSSSFVSTGHVNHKPNQRRSSSSTITIGSGPNHESGNPTSSRPADFNINNDAVLHQRHVNSQSVGLVPHDQRNSRSVASPAHVSRHRRSSSSSASIESGPAHQSFTKQNHSAAWLDCNRASADEKFCFRKADKNFDGSLEFDEIESLMQDHLRAKKGEVHDLVREIFDAADQNRDGKLDLQEFVDYTRSTKPSNRRLRDEMLAAFMAPMHKPRTSSKLGMRRASSASTAGFLISGSKAAGAIAVRSNVCSYRNVEGNRPQRMRTSMLMLDP